ncbi:MAG: universal stress protein [Anaerolineae bacterium]|nr:universal stress protein [Anaerolineae bacterium]
MASQGRYQKILVPLDGSGWAQRAVPHAVDIARSHDGSEVILLNVFTPPAREYADQIALAGANDQAQPTREQMKQYLIGLRSELRGEKVTVRTHLIEGTGVARLICDYVVSEGIDLVVMSTHGRTGLSRLLFGSVAKSVMECLDVPVLLVQPDKE